jgi:hypothetical protein
VELDEPIQERREGLVAGGAHREGAGLGLELLGLAADLVP